jgi:hypothetical protein
MKGWHANQVATDSVIHRVGYPVPLGFRLSFSKTLRIASSHTYPSFIFLATQVIAAYWRDIEDAQATGKVFHL